MASPLPLSTQYIAVSLTTGPFGSYTIFAIDTSDSGNTASGCPCFGDFDQVGRRQQRLLHRHQRVLGRTGQVQRHCPLRHVEERADLARRRAAPVPVVQRYAVPSTADPFAAYHLSPSTVTPGLVRPRTPSTSWSPTPTSNFGIAGLEVYALLGTSVLNSGGRPTLVMTSVNTEGYSAPAERLPEERPVARSASPRSASGVGQLQTDFNAVQEVTYASGLLYAELSPASTSAPARTRALPGSCCARRRPSSSSPHW